MLFLSFATGARAFVADGKIGVSLVWMAGSWV